jgi:hypothetical protein
MSALASNMSKAIRKSIARRLTQRLIIISLTSAFLVFGKPEVRESGVFQFIGSQPASAQFFRPQDVAQQVYQRLPDLPKENQYVSKETGKVNPNDTLVSRLIRYHVNVKSRPPNYRFDWKLTLADYLGANELIAETQYPSGNALQTNPMESDRALIQKLNRSQRDALVNVLVSIFSPNRTETSTPAPTPSASPPPPETPTRRATPSLPKPGDAQLLLP